MAYTNVHGIGNFTVVVFAFFDLPDGASSCDTKYGYYYIMARTLSDCSIMYARWRQQHKNGQLMFTRVTHADISCLIYF